MGYHKFATFKSKKEYFLFIYKKHLFLDHLHVIWKDGTQDIFKFNFHIKEAIKFPEFYDYMKHLVLTKYPERKKEEIETIYRSESHDPKEKKKDTMTFKEFLKQGKGE